MFDVSHRNRAQSEVVGSLLLVGVGIVLIGIVAVFALGFADDATSDPTTVAVDADVTASNLTITHESGDALRVDDIAVVLKRPDSSDRVPLSSLRTVTSDGDDRFTAGERFRLRHGVADGDLRVRVVHEPNGAVLYDRAFRITDGLAARFVDFDDASLAAFESGQDGSGTVTTTDDGITLTGNRWQRIPFEYNVTRDTVISFEFESGAEGEIHGIGLENDDSQTSARIIKPFGGQNWGVPVDKPDGTAYSAGDGTVTYEVPIGEKFAENNVDLDADIQYMVFVMDCDGNVDGVDCSSSDSTFRNVRVYEAENE
ncbi:type IV pilin N-terminal domain-containing protein [Halorientalis marina]|uniref:type IV pilin N-terminal domain-containing protein n=1 Tax=Halorientalis marina TaxID=2931976 RepID=UPI001FF3B8EB|nr:type IV pilin N-terminal domain-containing protein [Halorientalis marina]